MKEHHYSNPTVIGFTKSYDDLAKFLDCFLTIQQLMCKNLDAARRIWEAAVKTQGKHIPELWLGFIALEQYALWACFMLYGRRSFRLSAMFWVC